MSTIAVPFITPDTMNSLQSPQKSKDLGQGYGNSVSHPFKSTDLESGHSKSGSGFQLSVSAIIFLGILAVIGVFVVIACLISSIHRVEEGSVALYFRNGALQPEFSGPGIHTAAPFVTTVLRVNVRPETMFLDPMKCTTKDGVSNIFKNVQVISSINTDRIFQLVSKYGNEMKKVLIYDRIAQGIQDYCANNSIDEVYNTKFVQLSASVQQSLSNSLEKLFPGGINILNLFIPKPDIPPAIAANYREVKIEWTRQLVAQQKQKTDKIHKETVLQNAVFDAEREKEVSRIENEKLVQRKTNEENISEIENSIRTKKENTNTDIRSYRIASDAKNNAELLTDQYIKLQMTQSMLNNTKIFFSGQDSALGSLLSNILKVD